MTRWYANTDVSACHLESVDVRKTDIEHDHVRHGLAGNTVTIAAVRSGARSGALGMGYGVPAALVLGSASQKQIEPAMQNTVATRNGMR